MSDNTSDPDRIERDLDQTRSRLGSHLSELQDRLSPGQVIDDLMGYFRGSEGADFGRSLLDSVRGNPLPAAVTGIGLAWLMASGPRQGGPAQAATPGPRRVNVYRGTSGSSQDGYGYDDMNSRMLAAEQGVARQTGEAEQAYAARIDEARGQAIGLARQAQESAESFAERIRQTLGSAKQTLAESTHDMRDGVGAATASLGEVAKNTASSIGGATQTATDAIVRSGRTAGQTGGNLVSAFAENPVLLGVLGLAAGALLGALLPQSEQEEAALGDIAGQARETARGLAHDAVDRGGNVARAVLGAGRESAQAHDLGGGKSAGGLLDAALSGELAGNAKEVAQDMLRASDEAVRNEVAEKRREDPHAT
jgi:hypothetical protein